MTRKTPTLAAALAVLAFSLPAYAADPIKIGVLLPSSGVFAGLGGDQTLALEMGFDDFGREVAGRPIELVLADSEGKPATGLAQFKRLAFRDEVDIVVGIISSAVAGAVRDVAHNAEVPLIISNAGNNALTGEQCSPWILRTSFSNAQIVREMGPWMAAKGYNNVFLMAFDYAAGHQMMDAFREGFVAAGGNIAGEEFPPLGETKDFGPYLAKVKAADPDAAFVFFAGGPAIKFVKEWAAFGLKGEVTLAGAGWLNSALYVKKQGMDAEGAPRDPELRAIDRHPGERGLPGEVPGRARPGRLGVRGGRLRQRAPHRGSAEGDRRRNRRQGGPRGGDARSALRRTPGPLPHRSDDQQRHPEHLHFRSAG